MTFLRSAPAQWIGKAIILSCGVGALWLTVSLPVVS